MKHNELSERIVEADFLWHEISVGDFVELEGIVVEGGLELCSVGQSYRVLAKQISGTGAHSFLTETNDPGRNATVYPQMVCNYHSGA